MIPERSSFQRSQQGGLTIIMALVLVSVLGAATFSLSRNVVRELSMSGTVVQGEKAASAADAGLDWVITWGQGHVFDTAYLSATPTGAQVTLVQWINDAMNKVVDPGTGMLKADLPLQISGASDPTMRVNNLASAPTNQTFDVDLRYLGEGWGNAPIGGTGGDSNNNAASGNKKAGGGSRTPVGWRGVITGNATPSGTSQTYQAKREIVATFPQ